MHNANERNPSRMDWFRVACGMGGAACFFINIVNTTNPEVSPQDFLAGAAVSGVLIVQMLPAAERIRNSNTLGSAEEQD